MALGKALAEERGDVVYPGHPGTARGSSRAPRRRVAAGRRGAAPGRDHAGQGFVTGQPRSRPGSTHRVRGFVLTGRRSQSTADSRAILDHHWTRINGLVEGYPSGPWMRASPRAGFGPLTSPSGHASLAHSHSPPGISLRTAGAGRDRTTALRESVHTLGLGPPHISASVRVLGLTLLEKWQDTSPSAGFSLSQSGRRRDGPSSTRSGSGRALFSMDDLSDYNQSERAVLTLGRTHLECQMEGVATAMHNLDPALVRAAIDGATLLGRADMASMLDMALRLRPAPRPGLRCHRVDREHRG